MPNSCTVCMNNSGKNKNLSFFSYPSDQLVREEWLQIVDRQDLLPKLETANGRRNYKICEQHFEPICIKYSRNKTVKFLTDNAYPTLNLPINTGGVSPNTTQSEVNKLKETWENLKNEYRRKVFNESAVIEPESSQHFFDQLTQIKEDLEEFVKENAPNETIDDPIENTINAPARKRKQLTEFIDIQRKKLRQSRSYLEVRTVEESTKSEDYCFLMSLLPYIEDLEPKQKYALRIKFNEILMEELDNEEQNINVQKERSTQSKTAKGNASKGKNHTDDDAEELHVRPEISKDTYNIREVFVKSEASESESESDSDLPLCIET